MSHSPGDKVFAKIKGFSNWPARIPKGKLPIFFYGTYQVSFVPVKNIVPYEKFKEKWGKPKSNPQFMAALEEIETNPGIYMLGEDPRAEKFLLQFYEFKSSSQNISLTDNYKSNLHHEFTKSESLDSDHGSADTICSAESESHEATADLGGVSTNQGDECSRKYKRHCSRKSQVDEVQHSTNSNNQPSNGQTNHLSDTSSDISSDHSRGSSLDPHPIESNDDEGMNKDTTHQLLLSDDYFQKEDTGSTKHRRHSSTDHSSEEKDSHHKDREARRLARKMQKKAEKKALKKAAKREAKRLAKEKRAERRARKEAKRELKRLHKLEKQRLAEQDCASLDDDEQESITKSSDPCQENASNHEWGNISEQVTSKDMADHWSPAPLSEPIQTDDDSLDLASTQPIPILSEDRHRSPLSLEQSEDIDFPDPVFPTYQNNSPVMEELSSKDVNSQSPTKKYANCDSFSSCKRRELSEECDEEKDDDSQSDSVLKQQSNDVPLHKRPRTEINDTDTAETCCKSIDHTAVNNDESNERVLQQEEIRIHEFEETETKSSHESPINERNTPEASPEVVVSKSTTSAKHLSDRKRPMRKKLISISDSSDENDTILPEKKSMKAISVSSSDSDSENVRPSKSESMKTTKHLNKKSSSQSKEINSSSKQPALNESDKPVKSRKQKSSHHAVKEKRKEKQPEQKSNSVREERSSNDSNDIRQKATLPDPVTQLNHCCRDLKTSLIRGHENFESAVQVLVKIRSIPVRLPQLAEAWNLMDCIKKCRRYKLSSEVREAAQSTFQHFLSLQANATKEELSQAQALITAHQNRVHSVQDPTVVGSKSKTNAQPTQSQNDQSVHSNENSGTLSNSTAPSTTADVEVVQEPESLTADLEAKVDDVLSRIRAAEERMAAAASMTSTRPDTSYKSLSSHTTNQSIRSSGGRIIRASAVAAATAHMHDEEDEETVMSRVEQVAAYEAAATEEHSNSSKIRSPPPPPPLPFYSANPSDQFKTNTSPNVDLDLDSRIEMLMSANNPQHHKSSKVSDSKTAVVKSDAAVTSSPKANNVVPSSQSSSLLPALLAKRKLIADKLAATKAAGSPIKQCHPVTSPLPSPPPSSSESSTADKGSSLQSVTPSSKLFCSKIPSKDDELYDLLGV
ncbi:unnamed protein product [Trichobilharzia szidati]|nr:unnamed protein product [Trichobilharzia szidati]